MVVLPDGVFSNVLTLLDLNVAPQFHHWIQVVQYQPVGMQHVQIHEVVPHVKGAVTFDPTLTLDLDPTLSPPLKSVYYGPWEITEMLDLTRCFLLLFCYCFSNRDKLRARRLLTFI